MMVLKVVVKNKNVNMLIRLIFLSRHSLINIKIIFQIFNTFELLVLVSTMLLSKKVYSEFQLV